MEYLGYVGCFVGGGAVVGAWWWWINHRAKVRAAVQQVENVATKTVSKI